MNIDEYKTRIASIYHQAASGGDNAYYDALRSELERLSDSCSKAGACLTDEEKLYLIESKDGLLRYLEDQKTLRGGKS